VAVLSLGDAAARLGLSRAELEAMIGAGTIEALPTRFTRVIPTSEVVRLIAGRTGLVRRQSEAKRLGSVPSADPEDE
jgi:uncharacterized cupin superfamily protein